MSQSNKYGYKVEEIIDDKSSDSDFTPSFKGTLLERMYEKNHGLPVPALNEESLREKEYNFYRFVNPDGYTLNKETWETKSSIIDTFYEHQNIWRRFSIIEILSDIWNFNELYFGFGDKRPQYGHILDYGVKNKIDIGWTKEDLSEILIKEKLAKDIDDGLSLVPELLSIKEEGYAKFSRLINKENTKWIINKWYHFD